MVDVAVNHSDAGAWLMKIEGGPVYKKLFLHATTKDHPLRIIRLRHLKGEATRFRSGQAKVIGGDGA